MLEKELMRQATSFAFGFWYPEQLAFGRSMHATSLTQLAIALRKFPTLGAIEIASSFSYA